MPWSLKASGLLRTQYAAVGAASGAVFPGVLAALEAAAAPRASTWRALLAAPAGTGRGRGRVHRGVPPLLLADRRAWTACGWRRSRSWPCRAAASPRCRTTSSSPCSTALGAEHGPGGSRRCSQTTRRLIVDTGDEASVAGRRRLVAGDDRARRRGHGRQAASQALVRDGDGGSSSRASSAAAASTCGSSTAPSTPARRTWSGCASGHLGHKRSLALREYALGLEALDRLADGEPLWRVHEAVFAVLALESEPVDPRL